MKYSLEKLVAKINNLSLRERIMIFSAIAFMLVSLAKTLFMEPLLEQEKKLSANITQQKEKMKALQAQIDSSLQARKDLENSAQRQRLDEAQRELEEGSAYLQSRSDRLVPPEKMAELLEQVLKHNGRLQLVSLNTLPVAPLRLKAQTEQGNPSITQTGDETQLDKQLFKHGVELTVHGSYLDLLQYLTELERLPMQMFWGQVRMKVVRYPEVELSLTVYTLSLEKTWLQI